MYPNPNNGVFTINLPLTPSRGGHVDGTIDVMNVVGQVVFEEKIKNDRSQITVVLPASVANGVYMLKLRVGDEVQVERFTLEQ